MKKFLNRIFKTSRKAKVLVATVGVALGLTGVVLAGYGPNRPTFDWNVPADQRGSLTGPVFNSFINTDVYGDERAFVDAKDASITGSGGFQDQVPVAPGKEYLVRMYVHNNANQSTNASGVGVARNTRVRVELLPGMANGHGITGSITADNATPTEVYDTVDFRNEDTAFAVEYVPGSAKIENMANPNGLALPDSIVSAEGALIGYDQMNGSLPGCFEYSAYVTVRVRVTAPTPPNFDFNKQVREAGTTTYGEDVEVQPGDKVQWLITTENKSPNLLENVQISDALPPHMRIVPGSVRWIYIANDGTTVDAVQNDTQLFTTGGLDLSAQTLGQNGGHYIRFDTTALDDFADCEVLITNIAYIRSNQNTGEREDTASVRITKPDCKPTKQALSCEGLSKSLLADRKVSFTAEGRATGGATIQSYTYNFGDGTTPLTTDKTTVEHTYIKDGVYVSNVKVNGLVDGVSTTVGDDQKCVEQIPISTTENCPIPGKEHLPKNSPECVTTPPELPRTGMGGILGVFAGTTLIGTMAHKFILGRRF